MKWRRISVYGLLVIGIAGLIYTGEYSSFTNYLNENPGSAQAIIALFSVIISILIYRVARIQSSIEKAHHEPAIEITKFKNHDNIDSIQVEVSNYGEGPAIDLHGIVKTRVPDTDLSPIDSKINLDRKEAIEDNDWNLVSGSSLGPEEKNTNFVMQLTMDLEGLNFVRGQNIPFIGNWIRTRVFESSLREPKRIPVFEEAVEKIVEKGGTRLELEVEIEYRDGKGDTGRVPVFHFVLPIFEGIDFDTAIENGIEYSEYHRNPEPFENARVRLKRGSSD